MNSLMRTVVVGFAFGIALAVPIVRAAPPVGRDTSAAQVGTKPAAEMVPLPSPEEARGRAKLLHETVGAMLHLVHHHYYREDEGLPIPAATMHMVFRELAERRKVELRWLAVNAQAMNVNHEPKTEFEKEAVKAISAGKEEFEIVEGGIYRRVGVITLSSECLKCHLPNRKSNKNRAAGLVISMPVALR